MGDRLPSDHNYRLYSSICSANPCVKDLDWHLGTVNGIPEGQWIKLARDSKLMIRCRLPDLYHFLDLGLLQVGQSFIKLLDPLCVQIRPSSWLRSRIVVIKQADCVAPDPLTFAAAVGKRSGELGIHPLPMVRSRMALRVAGQDIVGYQVSYSGLSQSESILLQCVGLGGKRRMGCGVFHAS